MAPLDEFDQLSFFAKLKVSSRKRRIGDDDYIDSLNWYMTPIILLIMAYLLMLRMLFTGEMVQCWTPAEFSDHWNEYAERYCWTQSTYYVPPDKPLPQWSEDRAKKTISYYQWTPFILGVEAAMFFLPRFAWKCLRPLTGIRIKTLVAAATEAADHSHEERQKKIDSLARHVLLCLGYDFKKKDKGTFQHNYPSKLGFYVSALYIGIKLLYLLNIFCQFLLLQSFLGTKYNFYGIEILNDLVQGREWMETSHFPRVTMCDFEVRALGQPRKYSLQCVLVINLFNEKIFLFLWFWFAFVGILTIISLITWTVWFAIPRWREGGIKKFLDHIIPDPKPVDGNSNKEERFLNILRVDGQFLLKMIGVNVGEPVVYDIISAMWHEVESKKDKAGTEQPNDMKPKEDECGSPAEDNISGQM